MPDESPRRVVKARPVTPPASVDADLYRERSGNLPERSGRRRMAWIIAVLAGVGLVLSVAGGAAIAWRVSSQRRAAEQAALVESRLALSLRADCLRRVDLEFAHRIPKCQVAEDRRAEAARMAEEVEALSSSEVARWRVPQKLRDLSPERSALFERLNDTLRAAVDRICREEGRLAADRVTIIRPAVVDEIPLKLSRPDPTIDRTTAGGRTRYEEERRLLPLKQDVEKSQWREKVEAEIDRRTAAVYTAAYQSTLSAVRLRMDELEREYLGNR